MQSINVSVLNPLFFTAFFGTAAACVFVAIAAFVRWSEPGAVYLLAGSLLYLVGTILVTIVFNVPLNEALAAAEPDSADGASLWTRYVTAWTAWNHVRTAASLAGAALLMVAVCLQARGLGAA